MDDEVVLVLTQRLDPHADSVITALEQLGCESVRFNTDEAPGGTEISIRTGADGAWYAKIDVLTSERSVERNQIRAVWWRRPSHFALPSDLSLREREFASGEIEHALHSFLASLDCYWMSKPDRIQVASWKGEQLLRAQRFGFSIPRTVITSSPVEAADFFHACGGSVIFKVMSDPFLGAVSTSWKYPDQEVEPYGTLTTLLTALDFELLESIRLTPCLFQEYIPKCVELRVTIIGREVFAAEIESPDGAPAAVDWRAGGDDLRYQPTVLPEPIARRCIAFMESYGLNFSAMDLVVTPEGDVVFLENNPNGQYLFVENRLPELGITRAVATCLMHGGDTVKD